MNLLQWAKREIKGGAQTVQRDIARPVTHAVGSVAQAVQQAPQDIAQVVSQVPRIAQVNIPKAVAQINPADNNRTFKNPAGNGGIAPPSTFQQLAHSGVSNFVGNNAVKPLAQFPIDASNQIYNRVVAPAIGAPKLTPTQISPISGLSKGVDATGSLHQTIGSGIQTGLTIASGGLAKGIEAGVSKVIPSTAPKVVASLTPKIASNAAIGAGFNASATAGQGGTPKQIAESAATGAALGAAVPVAGAGAKVIGKAGAKVADNRVPLNSIGAVGKGVNKPPSLPPSKPSESNLTPVEQSKTPVGQGSADVQNTNTAIPPPQSPKTLKPDTNLDRSVQNILKTGTPEDAVQTIMDTTKTDLQTASKYVSRVAQQSNIDLGIQDATKNPKLGSVSVPEVPKGDYAQPTLNARFIQNHEQRIGQQALDHFNKLTPSDQSLLKQIETGTVNKVAKKAANPQAFKQAEQSIRDYYNTRHAYDRYLGIDVGYRTNYLRQLFTKAEQQAQDNQISLKSSNKKPGYIIPRSQETLGTDVSQALQKDINGASFNHAKLAYEKGLLEATGGRVAKGELVRTPSEGAYQQILNPYGQDLSVPKDVAHAINSRTWGPNDSQALNNYDKVNHGLKYVKLSGGAFHALTEAGNFIGQQIGSGKIVTNPAATGRLFKVFFSPKAMEAETRRLTQNGTMDRAALSGLTLRPKDLLADVNVSVLEKGKNKVAKYTGIQALHDATFAREMPYAKIKLFEQKTEGLDINNPTDLAKMREIARGINNLVGGINREVHGIKPGSFKWLQRGLLATDFTEAKIQTLFSALGNKGAAGNLARQAVLGKALLFGILASAGAAVGGEFKGKNPVQIAKNAAGNLLDPSFEIGGYKAKFPQTHISEVVGALKPYNQNKGAPWNASGLLHYAQARTAALPSEALQLASNKNYYGQPFYGKDTKKNGGGPISPTATGLNLVNSVAPIPFGQGVNAAQGKQNIAASVANVAGLNVRPNSANNITLQGSETNLTDPQRRDYEAELSDAQKKLIPQLTSSQAYKNMSPNDKATALSQLNKNITSSVGRDFASKNNLGQYAPNFTGKDTQATSKEQAILAGQINPDSYIKGSKASSAVSKSYYKSPDAEYKTLQNSFNQKAKTNSFGSDAEKIKAQKALDKAKVGSTYDKSVRDLYDLSKADIYQYVSTNKNGQTIANQLLSYDQALKNSGQTSTLKFKNGIAPVVAKGGSKSSKGGKKSTGKSSLTSYLATLKSTNAAIKPPKIPKAPKLSLKSVNSKKTSLKKYAIKKPSQSKVKVA